MTVGAHEMQLVHGAVVVANGDEEREALDVARVEPHTPREKLWQSEAQCASTSTTAATVNDHATDARPNSHDVTVQCNNKTV